jgi:hypothetical protein
MPSGFAVLGLRQMRLLRLSNRWIDRSLAGGHATSRASRSCLPFMRVSRAGRPVHDPQHFGAASLQKAPNKQCGEHEEGDAITPPKLMPPFQRTAASGMFPTEHTNETTATSGPTIGPQNDASKGW